MARKTLVTALKILAVCLMFALCFVAGGALSGLDEAAQQGGPSTPNLQAPPGQQVTSAAPQAPTHPTP